ncbi:MAG: hypothetical protein GY847_19120 [Proteobacteria bacterium]|nr:hypothetical protein [Pseudomonadota bacterium]
METVFGGTKSTEQRPSWTKRSINERRLSKYQGCGLFSEDTIGEHTRAVTATELKEAYGLVHDIFMEKGYILPYRSRMRVRPWETSPDTATFVSKIDDDIVGVFSAIADSEDLGLPSDESFQAEIDALRGKGTRICELSSQAIAPSYRHSPICTELMRCAFAHALHIGSTDLICAVSPETKGFFELIGFVQIGKVKNNSKDIDDPVVIMRLPDVQHRWTDAPQTDDPVEPFWRRFFVDDNPYIEEIDIWILAAQDMFDDSYEVVDLFGNCIELFKNSDPYQLKSIRRRLGDAFYLVQNEAMSSSRFGPYSRIHITSNMGRVSNPRSSMSSIERRHKTASRYQGISSRTSYSSQFSRIKREHSFTML